MAQKEKPKFVCQICQLIQTTPGVQIVLPIQRSLEDLANARPSF